MDDVTRVIRKSHHVSDRVKSPRQVQVAATLTPRTTLSEIRAVSCEGGVSFQRAGRKLNMSATPSPFEMNFLTLFVCVVLFAVFEILRCFLSWPLGNSSYLPWPIKDGSCLFWLHGVLLGRFSHCTESTFSTLKETFKATCTQGWRKLKMFLGRFSLLTRAVVDTYSRYLV